MTKSKLDQVILLLGYCPLTSLLIIPSKNGYKSLISGSKIFCIFYGIALNFLLYLGFQIFRFFQTSVHKKIDESSILDYVWLTTYSIAFFFYLHFLHTRSQIAIFLNIMSLFQRGLSRMSIQNFNFSSFSSNTVLQNCELYIISLFRKYTVPYWQTNITEA